MIIAVAIDFKWPYPLFKGYPDNCINGVERMIIKKTKFEQL